jgi:hypothetical protein
LSSAGATGFGLRQCAIFPSRGGFEESGAFATRGVRETGSFHSTRILGQAQFINATTSHPSVR